MGFNSGFKGLTVLSVAQDCRAKNNSIIMGKKFEKIRKETIMDPCNLLKYSTYIRSFSLYTQQWYMSYRFADSLRAGSGWNCSVYSDKLLMMDRGTVRNI